MTQALVPSNHTPREHALAEALDPIGAIDPAVLETLWDAWRCPATFLPFLAYALSVDFWDDAWDEIRKREVIAGSPAYHRRKGTVAAVMEALTIGGHPASLTEWFDRSPNGRRGTSTAFIECEMHQIPSVLREVTPRVMRAKPKSRPVVVGAGPRTNHTLVVGAGVMAETLSVIRTYRYAGEFVPQRVVMAIALHTETLTTVGATQ